jgi:hypothetical protein
VIGFGDESQILTVMAVIPGDWCWVIGFGDESQILTVMAVIPGDWCWVIGLIGRAHF